MPLNGIDVSNHDGNMGFSPDMVKADFVICKATEGCVYKDSFFRRAIDASIKAGRLVGAYHFARSNNTPEAQANYFVDVVKPYIGKAILFLDWENADSYDLKTLDQGPSFAKRFLDRVYSLTGVRPMIYMSKSVCREYDWSAVAPNYGLWAAQYASMDAVYGYQASPWTDKGGWGAWSSPMIYQYTGELVLTGWKYHLDGDIAYMTRDEWARHAKGAKPTPKPSANLVIDGYWGTKTTTALQKYFGTTVDGVVSHQWPTCRQAAFANGWEYDKTGKGSQLIRAIQGAVDVYQDGLIGPHTINALQRHMGTPIDGELSGPSLCVKEMQKRLNEGRF